MAETLSTLSTISFVISGIAFAVTVFLWFKFQIPAVFGDLTGRTARKSIAQMRANNEQSGRKPYRSSTVNVKRGKITASMEQGAKTQEQTREPVLEPVFDHSHPVTDVLHENRAEPETDNRTELLSEAEETGLLSEEESNMLLPQKAETAVRTGGKKLVMLDEVMYVHTHEVIDLNQFNE